MKKVLVIGSANMDFALHVKNLPVVGETVLCNKMEVIPGGKGGNQAYTIGKLGGNVAMLGAVGNDEEGHTLIHNLASVGVDTSHFKISDRTPTGRAFICVDESGNNSIVVAQGANGDVNIPYIMENIELLEQCDLVVLQLEIPIETAIYAAKTAKSLGKTVILDPAPARANITSDLYSCVDYLKPNEVELGTILHMESPEKNLERATCMIQDLGVKNVLVTLGEKGAFLREENGVAKYFRADNSVAVVDTTAAGDSFTGAFAYALSLNLDVPDSTQLAMMVSNIVVTRMGAQTSIPSMDEVRRYADMQKSVLNMK